MSSSRGRPSRSRNGPRSHKPPSTLPQKPMPPVSTDKPPRRNSAQSSPVSESPASPASSRSSNRRKRSGAGRGNNVPKINPPLPDDNVLRTERSRFRAVPHPAPVKDLSPHLTQNPPRTPTSTNKDIDALVERVRAVAMADHRPSTPGSHFDWAGDDDDSLPDLNDWGIPSLPDPTAHTISPIIVDGLRHLPELSSGLTAAAPDKSIKSSPLAQEVPLESGVQKPEICLSSPPEPRSTPQVHLSATHEPVVSCHTSSLDKQGSFESPPLDETTNDTADPVSLEEKSRPERGGLAASIHAPQNAVTPNSAPGGRSPGGRLPRYQQPHHTRAHTVGRPFPRLNHNDTNSSRPPRQGGSPKQHTRNYSSPAAANRHSHSRPILTGDALSRLVKAVGGTTVPSAKPTPLT